MLRLVIPFLAQELVVRRSLNSWARKKRKVAQSAAIHLTKKIKAVLRAAFLITSGYSYEVKASIMLSSASM
ncbi:hypothetical protein B9G53_12355 [Pseudanabaena sp. SR411]|nr:hypothetical protein B9G53_12355 [Pseudanabaena sp. SR411]